MSKWESLFASALETAAAKAGFKAPKFAECTTDNTWGDRVGLVFYGETSEVNERAARLFEAWARKNLRKIGAVGGYSTQASISYVGIFHFTACSNGASGWYRGPSPRGEKVGDVVCDMSKHNLPDLTRTEMYEGYATSYVYYPGAD